ncbi:hypothetical protein PN36_08815 [Candidatus Thiomargarita nelsonii]|uniref:Lipoprotein n=1 Tax=Candidatus Thiomargarita nelsonii TaxID=1003181 RepID=A0A0A6PIN8_9GAMM|nr:hypothetical protein PN36_08815 [Candidatus Thiomargarita nelsonii]
MNKIILHIQWVYFVLLIGVCFSTISCQVPVEKAHSQTQNSVPIMGIVPFSKFVSDGVRAKMGIYYQGFEAELVKVLQNQGVSVTLTQYPADQVPFTYEEMEAIAFEFATPEQILSDISSQGGFDKVIFGHLELLSESLYLVVRVYSRADNKVEPAFQQKIGMASVTSNRVKIEIKNFAAFIVNGGQNNDLFGLDI